MVLESLGGICNLLLEWSFREGMKSEEYFKKACEMLIDRGITPVRHFSPFAEGSSEAGSGVHRFWDKDGRLYTFLFNDKGDLIWSNIGD